MASTLNVSRAMSTALRAIEARMLVIAVLLIDVSESLSRVNDVLTLMALTSGSTPLCVVMSTTSEQVSACVSAPLCRQTDRH
jgi:hypothetical protein